MRYGYNCRNIHILSPTRLNVYVYEVCSWYGGTTKQVKTRVSSKRHAYICILENHTQNQEKNLSHKKYTVNKEKFPVAPEGSKSHL